MPKVDICQQKIIVALESRSPKTLTEIYRILGGTGKLSGTLAAKIREAVPGIEKTLAQNKDAETVKSEGVETHLKSKPPKKAGKKPAKTEKNAPKATGFKSKVPRHPKNPFRPESSSYGILVDLIAQAGVQGIGRDSLLKEFCRITGKDEVHAKYDLAVINSAVAGGNRHKSCKDGFVLIKDVDNYRIRFD